MKHSYSKAGLIVEWTIALKRIAMCDVGRINVEGVCSCGLNLVPIWDQCKKRDDKVRKVFIQNVRVESNDTE